MDVMLIGAGGQCKSMIPIVKSIYNIKGIICEDKDKNKIGDLFCGFPILYTDSEFSNIKNHNIFVVAIGQTPLINPLGRKKMFELLLNKGITPELLISKVAVVHGHYYSGVVIHDLSFIGVDSVIGEGTIINTGAIVEHDVIIGNYCHVCPGATVLGGVKICDDVIIGAGSVVVSDIKEPGFYAGLPAKPIVLRNPKTDIKIVHDITGLKTN